MADFFFEALAGVAFLPAFLADAAAFFGAAFFAVFFKIFFAGVLLVTAAFLVLVAALAFEATLFPPFFTTFEAFLTAEVFFADAVLLVTDAFLAIKSTINHMSSSSKHLSHSSFWREISFKSIYSIPSFIYPSNPMMYDARTLVLASDILRWTSSRV